MPKAHSARSPASQPIAQRPPQQARSVATRLKLLDATISCLTRLGYAGTSTTEVCREAGVSQGALFKHFPTKSALLSASVEHLFQQLVAEYRRAFDRISRRGDRVRAALDLLWKIFRQPRLAVAFELYAVARCDASLRAALKPVHAQHRRNLLDEARALFPEAASDNPNFNAAVLSILTALQGLALGVLVSSERDDEPALRFLEQLARVELMGESR